MMMLLQQNKKRREPGKKLMWNKLATSQDTHDQEINAPSLPLRSTFESVVQGREGGTRREFKKRGRGMKDRVDKSMGIVTRIAEALARIKPTDPLRLADREVVRKKRNCSLSLS
jgi:hypothetical protein